MKRIGLLGGAHIFQLICSLIGTIFIFRGLELADLGRVISIVVYNTVLVIPMAGAFAKIYSATLVREKGGPTTETLRALGWGCLITLGLLPTIIASFLYDSPGYILFAFLLACMSPHKMNLRHAEIDGKFERIAVVRICVGVVLLGVKYLAAVLSNPYIFAASFVLEQFIYLVALPTGGRAAIVILFREGATLLRLPQLRSVIKLLPTEFASSLTLKYPVVMFAALSMPEAAALYNAAVRLPEAFNALILATFGAVRPNAYRESTESDPASFPIESTREFVRKAIWLTLVSMVVVPWILPHLFGESYRAAQFGAGLYLLVSISILMAIIQEIWLISSEFFRISAYRVFLGAGVSVLCTTVLFQFFGLEGAILGVVTGAMVQSIFSNLLFKQTRHVFLCQMSLLGGAFKPSRTWTD